MNELFTTARAERTKWQQMLRAIQDWLGYLKRNGCLSGSEEQAVTKDVGSITDFYDEKVRQTRNLPEVVQEPSLALLDILKETRTTPTPLIWADVLEDGERWKTIMQRNRGYYYDATTAILKISKEMRIEKLLSEKEYQLTIAFIDGLGSCVQSLEEKIHDFIAKNQYW
jgi:hypothetical protein